MQKPQEWAKIDIQSRKDLVMSYSGKGYSARDVAEDIFKTHNISGVTKNTIIGMKNRNLPNLTLTQREVKTLSPAPRKQYRRPRTPKSLVKPMPKPAYLGDFEPNSILYKDAQAAHCKYIIGASNVGYDHIKTCGHHRKKGSSYCDFHAKATSGHGTRSERNSTKLPEKLYR